MLICTSLKNNRGKKGITQQTVLKTSHSALLAACKNVTCCSEDIVTQLLAQVLTVKADPACWQDRQKTCSTFCHRLYFQLERGSKIAYSIICRCFLLPSSTGTANSLYLELLSCVPKSLNKLFTRSSLQFHY